MRLKDLQEEGAFVSDQPVRKTVSWKGKEFDVLVKRSSFADIELRMMAPNDQSKSALTVSQSVVLADTGEPFPYEQALRLDKSLMAALLKAVREVNEEEESVAAKN